MPSRKSSRKSSSSNRVTRKNVPTSGSSIKVGDVLDGRWQVLKKLGQGGMGSVWQARHLVNGRMAAIKVMLPSITSDPLALKLFDREGLLNNILDDAARSEPVQTGPGAVKVFDNGTLEDGSPYMVMEMLKGSDLGHLAQQGMLTGYDILLAADNVLYVLEGAHERGIIHRDIKPDNIFITSEGDVRLLDTGLARQKGTEDFPSGAGIGTPGYMPPEQVKGYNRSVGPESDIYAVGATVYQLLAGQPPTSAQSAMDGIDTCPGAPLKSVAPYVPDHVAAAVGKAIACRREDRYQTAREMRQDLELAMAEWTREHG